MNWPTLTTVLCIIWSPLLYAQTIPSDTLYYDSEGNSCRTELADYYKIFSYNQRQNRTTERTFYKNHTIRSITHFEGSQLLKKIDTTTSYYRSGQLNCMICYNEKNEIQALNQFHRNGQKKRIEYYENGRFIRGKKYNDAGRRVRFSRLEKPPTYNGGYQRMINYLNRTIQYPKAAKDRDIQGTVYVSFIVTKQGTVQQPKIIRSVHPLLDEEALRVVRLMKQWIPGKLDDQKINTRVSIPINFGKPHAQEHIPTD